MHLLNTLLIAFVLLPFSLFAIGSDKSVITDTSLFIINQSIPLMARIDTGASRTSINATNIQIKNASKNMKDNIGKPVSFTIVDAQGNKFPISSKVLDVKTIKTPQGKEHRYLVSLSLTWNDKTSNVKVNLRDRSNLEYKLLIGRDWLNENARVDTGATSTSINATNMKVHNRSQKMTNNVGKMISFDISNSVGDVKRLSAMISQVIEVTNAIGSEYRYKVAMKIQWRNKIQMLEMNLKDRSKLTYKMLIGRDWLSTNAIVDSSL